VRTWASGPAAWIALAGVLVAANVFHVADRGVLAEVAVGLYAANLAAAAAAVLAFVDRREAELAGLRTSTSTALRSAAPTGGEVATFRRLLRLFPGAALERCEALTLIKYDAGDRLAPHYDANRAAAAEDAARGGQTCASCLVYLNDVADGGATKFGKLGIEVAPRKGSMCVFFPADARGRFDDRLEHEGAPPRAEKWIGRVWIHESAITGATGVGAATAAAVRRASPVAASPS